MTSFKKWLPVTIAIVALLVGGSVSWAMKATLPIEKIGATELAMLPTTVATPTKLPTDWDTEWSTKLGIRLIGQYDSSGPDAWDAKKHPLVYLSTNSLGYGGTLSGLPDIGLVIIDADTYEVVLTKQYKVEGIEDFKYFESHGLGVSPDGKWIYLPTADMTKSTEEMGLLLVINARTLEIDKIIGTKGRPHHIKAFKNYEGKDTVLVEMFNWQPAVGSGIITLDPNDNQRVTGGIDSYQLQANPYLAFAHPSGRYLFIGNPPGPIRDPDISHVQHGSIAVIDMKDWTIDDWYLGGYTPIWTIFTADGKYAYVSDGGSNKILKFDLLKRTQIKSKQVWGNMSSVNGVYGIRFNYEETMIYEAEKGEGSHNLGTRIGKWDPVALKAKQTFATSGLRYDHGISYPWPDRKEIWFSSNSAFLDAVFNTETDELVTEIKHSGSSHNGAFVQYTVMSNGTWQGELLSDQNGFHGSARKKHDEFLGVTQIYYGEETFPANAYYGGGR